MSSTKRKPPGRRVEMVLRSLKIFPPGASGNIRSNEPMVPTRSHNNRHPIGPGSTPGLVCDFVVKFHAEHFHISSRADSVDDPCESDPTASTDLQHPPTIRHRISQAGNQPAHLR